MADKPLLYGADGKPYTNPQALNALEAYGITRNDNGSLTVDAKTLARVRNEGARAMSVSHVPSTPRHLQRDGGGVGVTKGHGRWEVLSHDMLRALRERTTIIQAIHSARHHQVRRMSTKWSGKRGEIGWKIVHKDNVHEHRDPPENIKPFIKRMESIFEKPSEKYDKTLASNSVQLEEDLLTINRPTVEVLHSVVDKRRINGFRAVDGALVWPTLLWIEKWMRDTPEWNGPWDPHTLSEVDILQIASTTLDADLMTAEFCLVRDGVLENVFPHGKILCAPIKTRTDISVAGYPPGNVEQAIQIILGFVNTWDFNDSYFTRGMLSEFILGISGNVHDDDIDAFVDMLREATQGVRRAWQPPVMPLPDQGTIQKIDLKPSNKEMMFEVWMSLLIALCTAVYRMDPSTVNAKPWDGGSSPSMQEGNRSQEISLAKEEGLHSDLQWLADNIYTPICRRCHPDLVFVWEFGDYDPHREAEIHAISSKIDMSRNDVRIAKGNKPRGFWLSDNDLDKADDETTDKYNANPWNMPADAPFATVLQQQKQAEMQEKMMEGDGFGGGGMGDPGMGGPPGGGMGGAPPPGGGQPGGQPGGFPFGQSEDDDGFGEKPMRKGVRVTVYEEGIDHG